VRVADALAVAAGTGALIVRAVRIAAFALVAASCGVVDGGSDQPASPSTMPTTRQSPPAVTPHSAPPQSPSPTGQTPSPSSVPPGVQGLVDVAVADLATRAGVPADAITVVRIEAVTWPDRSLGCPVPGMRYEQVPVDGALIVLAVDSVEYDYHSGGSRPPFLCTTKG
jgi:hypothetical protein